MKNVIELLEKQYQSFMGQERDWNFFLGLADYVDFLNKRPELKGVLKKIENTKENDLKNIEKLDEKAISELKTIRVKILKFFKNKKTPRTVAKKLKELAKYKIHNKEEASYKHSGLESKLKDMIKFLWMNNYKNLVQEILVSAHNAIWVEPKKEIPEEDIIHGFYELSASAFSLIPKGCELTEKRDIELWGAYDRSYLLWLTVFHLHNEKYTQEFKKYKDEYSNSEKVAEEMWAIQSDGAYYDVHYRKKSNFSSSNDSRIKELKRGNYQLYATRIHHYLIQELSKKEVEKVTEKQIKETALYLNQNGDLYKEPKERYCYPMSESKGRHKIVRYFVENKIYNYYPTRELATVLEKDEASLMKEIGKINTIIQDKLKFKDRILVGKRGSGYRINPNYKIILKNE